MTAGLLNSWERIKANWAGLAIGVALIAGLGMSAEYLTDQRQSYEESAGEAARCQRLAQQIIAVRGAAPPRAEGKGHLGQDASDPIATAVEAADIGSENVDRIEHQTAQRVGATPYTRTQTGISLKSVSMQQVVAFLNSLDADSTPLLSQSLRFTPAGASADDQRQKDGELWDVGLTVVAVRYNPQTGRSAPASRGP